MSLFLFRALFQVLHKEGMVGLDHHHFPTFDELMAATSKGTTRHDVCPDESIHCTILPLNLNPNTPLDLYIFNRNHKG